MKSRRQAIREAAIYSAVHEQIVQLRIEAKRHGISDVLDFLIAQYGGKAANDAVTAAYPPKEPAHAKR